MRNPEERIMNWRAIAAAALLWSVAGTASAVGRMADITVFDRGAGRTLPAYRHEGRFYVVGRPGNEYEIRVRNRTGTEILAVLSVDGVNAVSGETANWHQTGYVLAPYQTLAVKGWRKSLRRVAAFYFTEHTNSYAARTGRPQNVGVVGVALFRKRAQPDARIDQRPPRAQRWGPADESPFPDDGDAARQGHGDWESPTEPAPFEQSKRETGDATAGDLPGAARQDAPRARRHAPESYAAEKSSSLGTGHGRRRTSHARYTSFERASDNPAEIVAIHYDTYQNLVRLGVIGTPQMATPFPGQFVPDPR
jgi:hypothetical protein